MTNWLKNKWRDGDCVFNGWCLIPSGFGAEVLAHQGYGSLTIDMQHGLIDSSTMLTMLQAIAATPTIPVVRVSETNLAEINRALDYGARGIICPLVNTRAEAELLAQAAYYPPKGRRSFGPARAGLYADGDILEFGEQSIATFAMIETEEALDNIDDILSVDGIDAAYLGPADISLSMGIGLPTPEPHKRLDSAITKVLEACRRHEVVAGIHAVPGYSPAQFREKGFQFVTSGIDLEFMIGGSRSALAACGEEN